MPSWYYTRLFCVLKKVQDSHEVVYFIVGVLRRGCKGSQLQNKFLLSCRRYYFWIFDPSKRNTVWHSTAGQLVISQHHVSWNVTCCDASYVHKNMGNAGFERTNHISKNMWFVLYSGSAPKHHILDQKTCHTILFKRQTWNYMCINMPADIVEEY